MQISKQWLQAYLEYDVDNDTLLEKLNMAGLEVDSAEPVAGEFSKIVVGLVTDKQQHPDADRLSVCTVEVGAEKPLQIVCGAKNVAVEMKVPVALVGAVLPGDFKIKKSKLRGVVSQGMICSESELGLAESSDGIMPLPTNATIGIDVRDYLQLDDIAIDIDLTANRGDCLSIVGLAREVAALTNNVLKPVVVAGVESCHQDVQAASVVDASACPRYLTRLVRNVNSKAQAPLWLKEKLRRSGIRSISLAVDITNYVMLLLGQPMHAFDADKLQGEVVVRQSKAGEKIILLDGAEITLQDNTLLITDGDGPIALAGIMGGERTAVSDDTQNIVLESAYFSANAIRGKAREYGLHTDSSHRFERGIDPQITEQAMQLATQLLVEFGGGEAGPAVAVEAIQQLPESYRILLRKARVAAVLGHEYAADDITRCLALIGCNIEQQTDDQWQVMTPLHRYDLTLEIDLIEEIARLLGMHHIPAVMPSLPLSASGQTDVASQCRDFMAARGYNEAITYSFVDEQSALLFNAAEIVLRNPISTDLAVMRPNLLPGLLKAIAHNLNRQQNHGKLFEVGHQFAQVDGKYCETPMLSGVVYGANNANGWQGEQAANFYHVKGDVEALFDRLGLSGLSWEPGVAGVDFWHPGQCASVLLGDSVVATVGQIHPSVLKKMGVKATCFAFSIQLAVLNEATLPQYQPISKYPSIRRDLALEVARGLPVSALLSTIKTTVGKQLVDTGVFDVYMGDQVAPDKKSVAIYLILQDFSHTLKDDVVGKIMADVLTALEKHHRAIIRGG